MNTKQISEKLQKIAGTWSLPFTSEKAADLYNFVRDLLTDAIDHSGYEDILYDTFGDDQLFDQLSALESENDRKIAQMIQRQVKSLLDHYGKNPEHFGEELDTDAKLILEDLITLT